MTPAAELEDLIRQAKAEQYLPIIADAVGAQPGEPLAALEDITAYYAHATQENTTTVWVLKKQLLSRIEINNNQDCLTIHIPIKTITRLAYTTTATTYQVTIEIAGDRETILTENLQDGTTINRIIKTTYVLEEQIGTPTTQTLTSFGRELVTALNSPVNL